MNTLIVPKQVTLSSYKWEVNREVLTCKLSKTLKTGRVQIIKFLKFRTIERLIEWVKETYKNIQAEIDKKIACKELSKKEAKDHPFKEGTILYSSWGYEQTNIDYYLVTKCNGQKVELTPIGQNVVEGSYGHDSCRVTPNAKKFIGEPFNKIVTSKCYDGKKVSHNIKLNSYSWCNIYTAGKEGIYKSWYY